MAGEDGACGEATAGFEDELVWAAGGAGFALRVMDLRPDGDA